ncbi:hypothetical protein SAMD00019534_059720 [Acytostelium subglobosum LB1]|uniref:hypothetical protein n=1 Tax=Acytostelium subglobosum LB1 TaxID=1410327 RepID=UPI0006448992|nr:hypothetical protein SAMD00019534_059720 [Acytostelium subglobosum LB1]GAM22797.1 hypothetical protein SAMD00019534_059720 [Acytostelium subglobosum LB1]|eukprot:XP_012754024.1 hypothetical protein SAMD00019534_059720 [Acytostelium subglobosum LB1]
MARRGASSARISKAPATTSSAPKPTTASKPASAPTQNATPQPTPVVMQGPGLLSTMASSMAGAVAGNVIGHALVGGVSSMMGGNNEPQTQVPQDTNMQTVATETNVCNPIYKSFMNCLEKNSNDLTSCQFVYDAFLDCKRNGGGEKATYY